MSLYFAIQQAVADTVSGLGLTFTPTGGSPQAVPVAIRKIPKAEEGLDVLPYLAVTPSIRPSEWSYINFQGNQQVKYHILCAIIGSGNTDFYSYIDQYETWKEAIGTTFKGKSLTGVSQVWRTDVAYLDDFNRRLLAVGYDFLAIELTFWTIF